MVSSVGSAFEKETKQAKVEALIKYCEDMTQCRRKLILQYFGEKFDGKYGK